jgi:hypothetical protein
LAIVKKQFGGGHFGLMLLLREGLPGWLARAEQLLASGSSVSRSASTNDIAFEPKGGIPNMATPSFGELVRIVSNLVIPITREEVQHGS